MNTDLDTFETDLLSELRARVAARSVDQPRSRPTPSRRSWRRTAAGCGAVAAATAGAFLFPGVVTSPAYAVQNGPGGTVDVQVNRLEDAAGLRRALADHGVRADVLYLGDNLRCSPDRYRRATAVPDSSTRFVVGGEGISVELDRRDVAHGETVVIAASRVPDGVYAEVGIASGPVGGCRPTPLSGDS
ncbi:hypothetical protein [Actinopolymorpha rutila]|uniref:Uncharacterized protein n=1 Tax=Actinopolymorpha rutila TaxID=446787 RepID=A0A852Z863_9ACTN|nr:hypothetical protein [Actinopolymorpha rutila]NYH88563.1 hypothetical protein [Actinopolymorpha rutila]